MHVALAPPERTNQRTGEVIAFGADRSIDTLTTVVAHRVRAAIPGGAPKSSHCSICLQNKHAFVIYTHTGRNCMTRLISLVTVLALCAVVGKAKADEVCVGDCNGDGMVSIDELILGVNIALGSATLDQCPSFDADGDGMVGINELVTAVNNALNGCPIPPTPPPGVERVFTLFSGVLMSVPPDATRIGIFTSILGANAAILFSPGPLTLVQGTPDASGIAPLTLKEDVVLTVATLQPCLCLKFLAAGSSGSINCSGGAGPPYDTQAERTTTDPNMLGFTVTTGLGNPSGPGDGNLLLQTIFETLDTGCSGADDCATHVFTQAPVTFAFTTTTATAIQAQPTGGPVTFMTQGEHFACGQDFANPGLGMLAAPAPSSLLGVNVANVVRLAESQTPP
jgi:hypothetical protein